MWLVGLGLMSTLPTFKMLNAQYGYQTILGLGFGSSLTNLVIIARLEVTAEEIGECCFHVV